MMGGEGCWCHFINNKFFTFRKVYFLLKEVCDLLQPLIGFLLLFKHRKEIQTRRNGNYEKQKKMAGTGAGRNHDALQDVEARAMARVQTVKGTAAKDLYII